MKNKNIALIGFMGTGKTTVGKYISKKIDMGFIDTDKLIEDKNNMSIWDIFNNYGEQYFRREEKSIIQEICKKKNHVISTGGGIILDKENIHFLKKNSLIFLLDASVNTIISNLENSYIKRPLLKDINWQNKVSTLLNQRKELYLNNSDFIIKVDNKNIEEIGNEIIDIYKLNV